MQIMWIAYFMLGALTTAWVVWRSHASDRRSAFSRTKLDVYFNDAPASPNLWYKFRSALAPVIAGGLVWLIWPFAIIYMIWRNYENIRQRRRIDKELEEPSFECKPAYLINKISLLSAEKMGRIYDPSGTTPAVEFGYLHQAWIAFCAGVEAKDVVWTFMIPKGTFTNNNFQRLTGDMRGFAVKRKGKIVAEFIYECN